MATTVLPPDSELLAEANLAYHKLATGTAAVTVRDANGESITYNLASLGNLKAYIQEITDRIAMATASASGCPNPFVAPGLFPRASSPMRIWF